MPRNYLTDMKEWENLKRHYEEIKNVTLKSLFDSDSARAEQFTILEDDILFDYSKNRVTGTTMRLLIELAEACGLKNEIERMFRGGKINVTEDRAVLHVALRNVSGGPILVDGADIMPGR